MANLTVVWSPGARCSGSCPQPTSDNEPLNLFRLQLTIVVRRTTDDHGTQPNTLDLHGRLEETLVEFNQSRLPSSSGSSLLAVPGHQSWVRCSGVKCYISREVAPREHASNKAPSLITWLLLNLSRLVAVVVVVIVRQHGASK